MAKTHFVAELVLNSITVDRLINANDDGGY
jgi:hypothetical protein